MFCISLSILRKAKTGFNFIAKNRFMNKEGLTDLNEEKFTCLLFFLLYRLLYNATLYHARQAKQQF